MLPPIRMGFFVVAVCLATPVLLQAQAVGWRTDGTGRYPAAQPVTEWAKDTNILWATPLPGSGNAIPVLAGDRIFTTVEPSTVVCVNAGDGVILWAKTNSYEDVLGAEASEQIRQAAVLNRDVQKAEQEVNKLKEQIKKAQKNQQPEEKLQELRQPLAPAEKALGEAREKLKPFEQYALPATHAVNGFASATPVSDGKRVFAVFGTGVVAAYDAAGNRLWARLLEKPQHAWGHSASPVLVGGKLLVHIRDLVAFNPGDGKELWRVKAKPAWGTSFPFAIGGVDMVAVPCGMVVRVADGKILAQGLPALEYNSPLVQDGVLYWIQSEAIAYKLPTEPSEELKLDPLWKVSIPKDRYYASPLVHDGVLYAVNQVAMFSALDAATGQVLYQQKLDLGKGQIYPSATLGGAGVYFGGESGVVCVLAPGREYKLLTRNASLEKSRSSPVFRGDRLFLHTLNTLYCIGKKEG
ncbi:MAG: hypothetical protein A3K19_19125 [Lentisphaerae bacterium RIFOXYB12_FULL_65_16]|nr:MAG: hypothetical protein A3K18_23955 [Lentisphaerae bacterium RIFOXYA12_64_32]OGV91564.1 MAG: hypothetical protein A3K19_19125 [Lentisphaerae bacterium RIFOXYB12_FULL_65_16]